MNQSTDPQAENYLEQYAAAADPEPIPTPNDPPWNVWVALGVWVFSVLAIILFPSLLTLPYISTSGVQFSNNGQLSEFLYSDPVAVILQIVGIIPAHIVTLVLCWFVVTRARRFPFRRTLGWDTGGFTWWHYASIVIAFFVLAVVISNLFPGQDNTMQKMLRSSRWAVVAFTIMATFSAPLVEEVVYRGILYSAFQRTFGSAAGIALVTVVFALVHVPQYLGIPSTLVLLTMLSLILTLVRYYTNNLLPCIILHFIWNGLQSILLLLEPYIRLLTPEPDTTIALFILLK